jgi:lipopolysaccharide export system permease protein
MILARYMARRFLGTVALITAVFTGLLVPIDLMEQMRRLSRQGGGIEDGLRLAFLNLPAALYQILPLIVLLATLALFLALARSSEMVVVRASGRSGLRAVMAPVVAALGLGVVGIVVVNPIVAATQVQLEREAARFQTGISSVLAVSEEGVWLRQGDGEGQTVIRAARGSLDGTILFEATFLAFDARGTPVQRVDAARAELRPGEWVLDGAKSWPLGDSANPEAEAGAAARLVIPSTLTREQIRDSFGTPEAIPIFELPRFIAALDAAGFSARLHRMWLAMELANPLMLAGMVLIGAAFTMRHQRAGRSGVMVLAALCMGFLLYFARDFAQVLGEEGQIGVALAAWVPPVAAILLPLGVILHLEDG